MLGHPFPLPAFQCSPTHDSRARRGGWRRTDSSDTQSTTRWVKLSDQTRDSNNQKHLRQTNFALYILDGEIWKCFPFGLNQPKPPNSFRIMATHPICDDLGATDDWRSRGDHLRSNEVNIRFSPITRERRRVNGAKRLDSSSRFGIYAYCPTSVMT